MASTIINSY